MACSREETEGSGRIQTQGGVAGGGGRTLEARFSTRATMEFLKSVPAVRGRLVTSVMSCCPSGHMARRVGSMLWTQVAWPAALQDSPHPSLAICKLHGLSFDPQAVCEGQTGVSEGPSSQSPWALALWCPHACPQSLLTCCTAAA